MPYCAIFFSTKWRNFLHLYVKYFLRVLKRKCEKITGAFISGEDAMLSLFHGYIEVNTDLGFLLGHWQ